MMGVGAAAASKRGRILVRGVVEEVAGRFGRRDVQDDSMSVASSPPVGFTWRTALRFFTLLSEE